MNKEEWLSYYRGLVEHGDLNATMRAFSFYCDKEGLSSIPREIKVIQRLISLKALIRWVDVQFGVCIITDKDKYVVKVF